MHYEKNDRGYTLPVYETIDRLTPYRVVVFKREERKSGKRGKAKIVEYAYAAWNPELTEHSAHWGRLKGSGSFAWLGMQGAKYAAVSALMDGAHQVQIRTNQDRTLRVYSRTGFYTCDPNEREV